MGSYYIVLHNWFIIEYVGTMMAPLIGHILDL
jgi:hypothetical protein